MMYVVALGFPARSPPPLRPTIAFFIALNEGSKYEASPEAQSAGSNRSQAANTALETEACQILLSSVMTCDSKQREFEYDLQCGLKPSRAESITEVGSNGLPELSVAGFREDFFWKEILVSGIAKIHQNQTCEIFDGTYESAFPWQKGSPVFCDRIGLTVLTDHLVSLVPPSYLVTAGLAVVFFYVACLSLLSALFIGSQAIFLVIRS